MKSLFALLTLACDDVSVWDIVNCCALFNVTSTPPPPVTTTISVPPEFTKSKSIEAAVPLELTERSYVSISSVNATVPDLFGRFIALSAVGLITFNVVSFASLLVPSKTIPLDVLITSTLFIVCTCNS